MYVKSQFIIKPGVHQAITIQYNPIISGENTIPIITHQLLYMIHERLTV